jgi:hypothetical protein
MFRTTPLVLSQTELDAFDFRGAEQALERQEQRQNLLAPAGKEHYRMLGKLAQQFSDALFIDIGTHHGLSTLALASNPSNRVLTFDIADFLTASENEAFRQKGNITRSFDNLWADDIRQKWRDTLLSAAAIFLDIEPHNGLMEMDLFRWLDANGYRGWLVCDDIWYFKGMRDNFWYHVPEDRKVDLTGVGHWSGTGVIFFRDEPASTISVRLREDELGEGSGWRQDEGKGDGSGSSCWTVVTAYFDLAKRPDASPQIRERDSAHFLRNAPMTLALPVNMVVYCDPEWEDALRKLRPAHLQSRTRFIARPFEDFGLVQKWYDMICAARGGPQSHSDPRNTASYYLLCMLRYVMLTETIKQNPFASSHFAWVNLCIERMSWKSAMYFPRVWREKRERFSTCYIDYQPRALTRDLVRYYQWGRCGMCSGFFTGSADHMAQVSRLLLERFEQVALAGFGHADEQLFSLVYFDHPDLFEPYLGDYGEMVVNYGWVRDNAEAPVRNVLRNLAASNENPRLLAKLCARWLESVRRGCAQPSQAAIDRVSQLLRDAAIAAYPDIRTTVL